MNRMSGLEGSALEGEALQLEGDVEGESTFGTTFRGFSIVRFTEPVL
jgi:hypothetical protein